MISRVADPDMKYEFPAVLKSPKRNGIEVHFPDIPGLRITAPTKCSIRAYAQSALAQALSDRLMNRQPMPSPSPCKKDHLRVPVPLLLASKLALVRAMQAQQLSNVTLAKRLGVTEAIVRRLINPNHSSKIEKVEEALHSVGITVRMEDAI